MKLNVEEERRHSKNKQQELKHRRKPNYSTGMIAQYGETSENKNKWKESLQLMKQLAAVMKASEVIKALIKQFLA